MKKKIRQGVFETNSSSTHSICIAKEVAVILPLSIYFYFGEYGWERDRLYSDQEKASYLYTGLIANDRHEDVERIFEILRGKGVAVFAEEGVFEDKSYTNSKGEVVEYRYCENCGYVDHSGEMKEFLDAVCNDENALISYLFSGLSFVITGNDNDDYDVDIDVSYPYDGYYKSN